MITDILLIGRLITTTIALVACVTLLAAAWKESKAGNKIDAIFWAVLAALMMVVAK